MESPKGCDIISAREFNAIPDLHEQVNLPNDPAVVASLADIFHRHNLHERFGLHLLHRHYILPVDCIALKSQVDSDISLTKIEPIANVDVGAIRGTLYLLNDDGCFQAYEYEHGDPVDIPAVFLEELSEAFLKYKLEKVLALDIDASTSTTRFEYDYGRMATVTVELNRAPVEPQDRPTGLAFESEVDAGAAYGPNACPNYYAENVRGTHSVFYNHSNPVLDESNFTINRSAIRGVLVSNGILAY